MSCMSRNAALTGTVIAAALLTGQAFAGEGPFVALSFKDACKQAGTEHKVVFIDFYTTWCGPCKIMDATTFKDERVIQWLKKNTIALRVDAEVQRDLAGRFRVEGYPTLLFTRPDGGELDRIVGMRPAKPFLEEAAAILSGADPLDRARARLKESGSDNPMARMEYARKLVQLGKDAEALKEYLWCFDEGTKHGIGFGGVRLSFLLSEIQQLGRRYPPAPDALRQRRDAARRRVLNEKPSEPSWTDTMFGTSGVPAMDLAALNDALGEPEDTLKVYDALRARHPDWSTVEQLRDKVFDALLAAHRYAEIAAQTDISAKIDEEVELSRSSLAMIPKEYRKQMEELDRQNLIQTIARYYQVLIGLKKLDEAAKLAQKAIQIDDGPFTYNELAWNAYLTGSPTAVHVAQARQAYERSGKTDAAIVDTLARILDRLGRTKEACDLLRDAGKRLTIPRDRAILGTCATDLKCDKIGE